MEMSFDAGYNNNIAKLNFQSKAGEVKQKPAVDGAEKGDKVNNSPKLDLANKVDVNFTVAKSGQTGLKNNVSFIDNENINAKNTPEFKAIANVANSYNENAVYNKLAGELLQAAGIKVI